MHYCAGAPQNRTGTFARIRLKQVLSKSERSRSRYWGKRSITPEGRVGPAELPVRRWRTAQYWAWAVFR